ncbi:MULTISPECIES: cysteine hydrolase family protein [unclassified Micromonospora]|uniref:cysteine hydrolase family protein n=1 Tax=unclassified Micromonospora TaxID=2617518 RepID=UPI0036427EA9
MRELDPRRTAVVNIHWQHEIVSPDGLFGPLFAEQVARNDTATRAAQVTSALREQGGLVIYTRTAYRPGHPELISNTPSYLMIGERKAFLRDAPGTRIIDAMAPAASDIVIDHTRLTGFFGTALDSILRANDIDTLLITGVATNLSVMGTAFDAINYGYRIVMVGDACAAATDEVHLTSLETLRFLTDVADAGEVVDALRGSGAGPNG